MNPRERVKLGRTSLSGTRFGLGTAPLAGLFEDDWPVCLMTATYRQVLEAMKYSLSDLDRSDQEAILGGNAVRIYGLSV